MIPHNPPSVKGVGGHDGRCRSLNWPRRTLVSPDLHQFMSAMNTTAEAGKVIKYAPICPRLRRASAYAPPRGGRCAPQARKNGVLHHFSSLRIGLEGDFGGAFGAILVPFSALGAFPWPPARGGGSVQDGVRPPPPFGPKSGLNKGRRFATTWVWRKNMI